MAAVDFGPVRIKVCCISSHEEARMATRCGAAALGLVSAMPSGPGPIPEDLIADIVRQIPPAISPFLLTCATKPADIIDQLARTRASTVQIVDRVSVSVYEAIRSAVAVKIVQVVHVIGAEAIDEGILAADHVDALLLDSGNPSLAVKELGGTGRAHDWALSRRIRDSVNIPVFLAGGLTSANVAEAVGIVEPFGVDVCSGVRTAGRLDEAKLQAFVHAVKSRSD